MAGSAATAVCDRTWIQACQSAMETCALEVTARGMTLKDNRWCGKIDFQICHLLPASGSIDWHQLVVPPSLPTLLTGALGRGPSLSKDQPARGVKSYMSSPMKVTCSGFDSKDPGRASFPASWGGPTVLTLPRAPRWMWPSTIANA